MPNSAPTALVFLADPLASLMDDLHILAAIAMRRRHSLEEEKEDGKEKTALVVYIVLPR